MARVAAKPADLEQPSSMRRLLPVSATRSGPRSVDADTARLLEAATGVGRRSECARGHIPDDDPVVQVSATKASRSPLRMPMAYGQ